MIHTKDTVTDPHVRRAEKVKKRVMTAKRSDAMRPMSKHELTRYLREVR
jgi:hypothetical protein